MEMVVKKEDYIVYYDGSFQKPLSDLMIDLEKKDELGRFNGYAMFCEHEDFTVVAQLKVITKDAAFIDIKSEGVALINPTLEFLIYLIRKDSGRDLALSMSILANCLYKKIPQGDCPYSKLTEIIAVRILYLDDIKGILQPDDFKRIQMWAQKHGYAE